MYEAEANASRKKPVITNIHAALIDMAPHSIRHLACKNPYIEASLRYRGSS